jgi:hypothetical protein
VFGDPRQHSGHILGRSRRRWEDNIRMDLKELGCDAITGFIWLRIGTGEGL